MNGPSVIMGLPLRGRTVVRRTRRPEGRLDDQVTARTSTASYCGHLLTIASNSGFDMASNAFSS